MVKKDLVLLANLTIPKAENKSLPTIPRGSTHDILREVLAVYKVSQNDLFAFAQHLRGATIKESCSNIWHFIKDNIRYEEDPDGQQFIKTPARIWRDRFCDCKGYSIFAAACLKGLNISAAFRFVSFEKNSKEVSHVYIVVPGEREILIDPVINRFNTEKKYTFKKDYPMTQISRLSGIGCGTNCGCNGKGNAREIIPGPGLFMPMERSAAAEIPMMKQVITNAPTMAINSGKINVNLTLTPESMAENLLLLERLKIEMDIEKTAPGWNDIRLAMYQDAISRVQNRISILEGLDAKINGGLLKKILSGGNRKKIDAAFSTNPELGALFLYMFIPNGEAFRNSNTRDLMQNMPAAVQEKAKLQTELWNYLENKSQYGHENFGKLTRNSATQKLGKSPETFISELVGWEMVEGEKFWYGSTFPIIRGIGVIPFVALGAKLAAKPIGKFLLKNLPKIANIIKGLFGGGKGKANLESAFGIAIPSHLDPATIGPDIEKDFEGAYYSEMKIEVRKDQPQHDPIKKKDTLVNQILDLAIKNPTFGKETNTTPEDDFYKPYNNTGSYTGDTTAPKDNTPLLIGGGIAAAALFFLLKK